MAIYDIFESKETETTSDSEALSTKKDRFFSSLTARLLFFVLFFADLAWAVYSLSLLLMALPIHLITFRKWGGNFCNKRWVALKRSGICGVSLFIALFSPALGIMIACTYFLMYDKVGIQEVVPRSLQDQFQEFVK